mmetsp:Transcript_85957/g.161874  ORF Transcript_85957/g.161874 Transcript_85957/m.161874 type:complete len:875 (-) Transcript_85957:158-2782(-)
MADIATAYAPGVSPLQRTWQSFQALTPPVSPGMASPLSPPQATGGLQLLPPQVAATPPQAGPPRHSTGSMSGSLTSGGAVYPLQNPTLQRPNSVPSLPSPRQPTFVSPRVASPNQRKGYPTKSGTATPASSTTPTRPQPMRQIASNGVASVNGASYAARGGENGFYMPAVGRRDPSGVRARPVPMVTPPMSCRQDDIIDASVKSPMRMHTGSTVLVNKLSSVVLPGPYAGTHGVRTTPVPIAGVYHDAARQAREAQALTEGKNFAAATKLLMATEQQLATALSEAEALKKAERLLGAELSEAKGSSKTEERLLSEIADAQSQLQKEQADIQKLKAADAMLRSQVANHDAQVSEIEAKYKQELQEARRQEERVEAALATEMAELQRARATMERYVEDAAHSEVNAQEKSSQSVTRLQQLEAELAKARELPGMMHMEHQQALQGKSEELAVQKSLASEYEAKLREEASQRSEAEGRHALELSTARAEAEQAKTALRELREAQAKAAEDATDHAAMEASLQEAAVQVEQLTLERDQARATTDQVAGELTNACQSVTQLGSELTRVNQELVKNKATLQKMEADQAIELKEKSAVEAAYLESVKRIAELEAQQCLSESFRKAAVQAAEQEQATQVARDLSVADSATAALTAELSGARARAEQLSSELADARKQMDAMQLEASGAVPREKAKNDQIELLSAELTKSKKEFILMQEEASSSLAAKELELLEACKTIETLRSGAAMVQLAKVAGQDQDRALDKLLEDADAAAGQMDDSIQKTPTWQLQNLEGQNASEDLMGPSLDGMSPADVFYALHLQCEEHIWKQMQSGSFHAKYTFADEDFLPTLDRKSPRQSPRNGTGNTGRVKTLGRCASFCQPSRG